MKIEKNQGPRGGPFAFQDGDLASRKSDPGNTMKAATVGKAPGGLTPMVGRPYWGFAARAPGATPSFGSNLLVIITSLDGRPHA